MSESVPGPDDPDFEESPQAETPSVGESETRLKSGQDAKPDTSDDEE